MVCDWTCAELARRAAGIGTVVGKGERWLLLFNPGLELISAFTGTLAVGAVAVPVYPPRQGRSLARLRSILSDAHPHGILTTANLVARIRSFADELPELERVRLVAVDELDLAAADVGRLSTAPDPNDLAFLQYTSGSTAEPKGVRITHGNLLHNEEMIRRAFGQSEESVVVSWLPPYHDMGLIGGILQPLYTGSTCVLMAPLTFLRSPRLWLEAISRYRATTSGGPNFAYDLCVDKIPPSEREGLDLSCWRVAFNGSEPVRAETLERFSRAFAPYRFERRAFYPCYGLAEATLLVAGGGVDEGPATETVDPAALSEHRRVPQSARAGGRRLVASGRTWGQELMVVEPASGRPLEDGRVGEIWISGPSVAAGYWNRPELTDQVFGARLATSRGHGERRYLRTGDLGYLRNGELFVTGRLKDLIILRGRNHYPQDFERTAERAHPAVRAHGVAAFSDDTGGDERLVVVCEVDRRKEGRARECVAAVEQALAHEHEVEVHQVVAVRAGAVPKTSSGKVRRRTCLQAWRDRELPVLAASDRAATDGDVEEEPRESAEEGDLVSRLRREAAAVLGRRAAELEPDRPLSQYGLESLRTVELHHRLTQRLGAAVPLTRLLAAPSLDELADLCAEHAAEPAAPAAVAYCTVDPLRLTPEEHRLWVAHEMAPESSALHLVAGARVLSPVDPSRLEWACRQLAERHEALRSTFHAPSPGEEEPRRRLSSQPAERIFTHVSEPGTGWSEKAFDDAIRHHAFRPFDPASGPLFRVVLIEGGARRQPVLLICAHHLVADFTSMAILGRELGHLVACKPETLGPPPLSLSEIRERRPPRRQTGELREPPYPPLDLPTDRPRAAAAERRGGRLRHSFDSQLSQGVERVARRLGVTPFSVLLAGFQALLGRLSGRRELAVGITAMSRPPGAEGSVGYLVRPVAVHAELADDPSLARLVESVRSRVAWALESPAAERTDAPRFEVLFNHLSAPDPSLQKLTAFSVRDESVEVRLGGLHLRPLDLPEPAAQMDLEIFCARLEDRVHNRLRYDAGLFDPSTATRLLRAYETLLMHATAAPDRPMAELPLLTAAEIHQIEREWGEGGDNGGEPELLPARFATRAREYPDAVAVVSRDGSLSYGELEARSRRLAAYLLRRGVVAETPVGVRLERSADLVVALLGVLRAGGAYLPLDPSYPEERLSYMIEDAGADLTVTGKLLTRALDAPTVGEPELPRPEPQALAYVLYTSGSTGRPKGVEIPHRALANFLGSMERTPGLSRGDVLGAVTTLSFDISVLEIFLPLVVGARVAVAEPAVVADGARLGRWLDDQDVTVLQATPATWRLVTAAGWPGRPGLRMLSGGEPLPQELAEDLLPRGAELWNLYGPTETTVWSTARRIRRQAGAPSVGGPIDRTHVALLDRHLRPVPIGVAAEIYLAGAGLARGYRGRPRQTAEAFLPDGRGLRGARRYRVGDVGRWRPDGGIELLGRIDHQVKVRGHRIELPEIESVLTGCPGVDEAVVRAWDRGGGDVRLAAYVTPAGATPPEPRALEDHLRRRLPPYMVPGSLRVLDRLPRTPNGKVDRRALPEPEWIAGQARDRPRTPAERLLAGLWEEVLEIPEAGREDSFFDLGGHSLLAARLLSRIRRAFEVDASLADLLALPTLAEQARWLEAQRGGGVPPEASEVVSLPPSPSPFPLSAAQQRLWFLEVANPGAALYNLSAALELEGELVPPVLSQALGELARRHEALRTCLPLVDGAPVQRVRKTPGWTLGRVDLSGLGGDDRSRELARATTEVAWRSFDLAAGPLVRTALTRHGPGAHRWCVTLHHTIADGVSVALLMRELPSVAEAFVAGRPSPLPEPLRQYRDVVAWQERPEQQRRWEASLAASVGRLAGAPDLLELPTDRPRAAAGDDPRGIGHAFRWPSERVSAVAGFARHAAATPFAVLLASWALLLERSGAGSDLLMGTPVDGRELPELEGVVGHLAETLPLRCDLRGGPSFHELVRRLQREVLASFEHRGLPLGRLIEALQPERGFARTPLIQALFSLEEEASGAIGPPPVLGAATGRWVPVERRTVHFDLTATVAWSRAGEPGTCLLEGRGELFDPTTLARFAQRWGQALDEVLARPDVPVTALALLSAAERHQVTVEWGRPDTGPPAGSMLAVWRQRVAATPEATAVTDGSRHWTFAGLDRRARALAAEWVGRGVRPGGLVALVLGRGGETLAGWLTAWYAGAAYLPLSPDAPREWLDRVMADAGATVRVQGDLPAGTAGAAGVPALPPSLPADAAAYVVYTSGTTGRPKGVVVSHAALAAHAGTFRELYDLAPEDRVLHASGPAFDVAAEEVFPTWRAGGTVVVAPELSEVSFDAWCRFLDAQAVTVVNLASPLFRQWVEGLQADGAAPPASLRLAVTGSDAVFPADLRAWRQITGGREIAWRNAYGLTETTVTTTCWAPGTRDSVEPVLIGRPVAGSRVRILAPIGRPAAAGVAGELCVGGSGLAQGYLHRPALTAERFVPDPEATRRGEPGARLYRTGDRARFRVSGELELLGRLDRQVQVRGVRVEPEEIEAVLAEHPAVRRAAVTVEQRSGHPARLLAWLETEPGAAADAAALRRELARRLPAAQVPSMVTFLEALPKTGGGKIDRAALAARPVEPAAEEHYVAPRNEVEEAVAAIWRQVLGLERVSVEVSFFDAGGHSLAAIRVLAELQSAFGVDLPVRTLFEARTIADLAEQVEAALLAELDRMSDEEALALLEQEEAAAAAGGHGG